jgi:predicted PurR-regulated permease PerM
MRGAERLMSVQPNHHEEAGAEYSREQLTQWALAGITGMGIYLCWILARPFIDAIAWALALAVVARPLHRRLEHSVGPNAAALIAVTGVTVTLVVPGVFLIENLFREARDGLVIIGRSLNPGDLHHVAEKYPFAERMLVWFESAFDQDEQLGRLARAFAGRLPAAVSGSSQFITQFAIMLVTLFYFFRDHRRLMTALADLIPLTRQETSDVFHRISETIRATLYGNVAVKLIQGVLGGLMFWILGLPAPALFGALMALLAVLPMVGTAFVWGPAAIFLVLQGSWLKALVLVAWGALVVSLIDNLVYPVLVASEIRIHTLGILFAVFGGFIAFGIGGVILGPLIVAVTLSLLDVWRTRIERVRMSP